MSWSREGVTNSQNVRLMRFLHCLHFSSDCLHHASDAVALLKLQEKTKTGIGERERVDPILL